MQSSPRRGFILILVVVVLALLMLVCFTFSELMLTERKAAILTGRQEQALAAAESAVQMARIFLLKDKDTQDQAGGWYDNSSLFRGQLVVNDPNPAARIRFTIVAPLLENGIPASGIRFGLENESSKLNLNNLLQLEKSSKKTSSTGSSSNSSSETGNRNSSAGSNSSSGSNSSAGSDSSAGSNSSAGSSSSSGDARTILMNLPGMTQDIADSILDWLDSNDQPREYGAEMEYYSASQPPYAPKNGSLTTVEELLLVRDVTPSLLFGCDLNRNGRIDAVESSNANIPGVDNSDGSMNQGWSAYLTLYGKEKNVQSDGQPKIDLNGTDLEQLSTDLQTVLSDEQAAFIIAYRQNGPLTGSGADTQSGTKITADKVDLNKQATTNISSILDLIGAKVQIQSQEQGQEQRQGQGQGQGQAQTRTTTYESPFTNSSGDMTTYLPLLMDHTTVNRSQEIVGRVNINQAPRAVLLCIPGLTSDIVDEIIARRTMDPKDADTSQNYATWLLSEGIVTLKQMKALEQYVTCGGDVYRIQAIGYFENGEVAARIEVIIDAGTQPATVLFWRDISHLGRGFTVEELGAESAM